MLFRTVFSLGAILICATCVQAGHGENDAYELRSAIEFLEESGAKVHRNGQVHVDIVIHAPGQASQVKQTELPTTYTLNAMEMPSTPENLEAMMVLPEVDSLYLGSEFKRTEEAWNTLVKLGELKNLYIIDDLTDADFPRLAQFENLDMLAIRAGKFSPSSLWYLEAMHQLESLSLTIDQPLADGYFRQMPTIPNLRHLEMALVTQQPVRLDGIEHLTSLASLEIHAQKLPGSYLKPIGELTSLERLSLSEVNFSQADLKALWGLSQLQHLVLFQCELPSIGTGTLSRLENLKRVDLHRVALTDALLAEFAASTQLTHLYVQDAPLTDACLKHLARWDSLKIVRLSGTQITAEGVKWLREERPDLNFSVSEGF